jgi:hypothetical protein
MMPSFPRHAAFVVAVVVVASSAATAHAPLVASHGMTFKSEDEMRRFIRKGLCDNAKLNAHDACICANDCFECVSAESSGGPCAWMEPGELSGATLPPIHSRWFHPLPSDRHHCALQSNFWAYQRASLSPTM